MTGVDADTALVVIANVALVTPPGTMTLEGMLTTAALLLDRLTVAPPLGAGLVSITVAFETPPPETVAGYRLMEESATVAVPLGTTVMNWLF